MYELIIKVKESELGNVALYIRSWEIPLFPESEETRVSFFISKTNVWNEP